MTDADDPRAALKRAQTMIMAQAEEIARLTARVIELEMALQLAERDVHRQLTRRGKK